MQTNIIELNRTKSRMQASLKKPQCSQLWWSKSSSVYLELILFANQLGIEL